MKPSLVKGTRDFGPEKMAKRNYIFDTIKKIFQRYGFQPIETPTLENLTTLMGKYGDEGDQLLFKVLNSGDFAEKISAQDLTDGHKKLTLKIAEKGLKYDLTVPFARYVVMNKNELTFPFKRYQIQPVWRGDRPQKGRYREFYQCDADVVGTDSLLCEAEITLMIDAVMKALKIDYSLKINNRKILTGLSEHIGQKGQETTLAIAIDKLDKIGLEKVMEELSQRGFSEDSLEKLKPIFKISGTNNQIFEQLEKILHASEIGKKGIEELKTVWKNINLLGHNDTNIDLDITLARGLSYYTGAIFEVKANNIVMGSISGGGRYDNLTSTFGVEGLSGVGISFGVDRIYDVMEELNLFPENNLDNTQLLFCHLGAEEKDFCISLIQKIRENGINAEVYPDDIKIKKQMEYANKKKIPFVCIMGSDEIKEGVFTLKNMSSGTQEKMSLAMIINHLK